MKIDPHTGLPVRVYQCPWNIVSIGDRWVLQWMRDLGERIPGVKMTREQEWIEQSIGSSRMNWCVAVDAALRFMDSVTDNWYPREVIIEGVEGGVRRDRLMELCAQAARRG